MATEAGEAQGNTDLRAEQQPSAADLQFPCCRTDPQSGGAPTPKPLEGKQRAEMPRRRALPIDADRERASPPFFSAIRPRLRRGESVLPTGDFR